MRLSKSVSVALIIAIVATACRSSRPISSTRHAGSSTVSNSSTMQSSATTVSRSDRSVVINRDVNYEAMRQHVGQLQYSNETISRLIAEAATWIGTPYRYAGNSREGADCSGFVSEVYRQAANINIPRSSAAQQSWCCPLNADSIAPGDLVFFATGSDSARVSHVGLYIGEGEMIHASSSLGVIVSPLRLPYYSQRFHSAGRPKGIDDIFTTTKPESGPSIIHSSVDNVIQSQLMLELERNRMIEEQISEAVDSLFIDFFD